MDRDEGVLRDRKTHVAKSRWHTTRTGQTGSDSVLGVSMALDRSSRLISPIDKVVYSRLGLQMAQQGSVLQEVGGTVGMTVVWNGVGYRSSLAFGTLAQPSSCTRVYCTVQCVLRSSLQPKNPSTLRARARARYCKGFPVLSPRGPYSDSPRYAARFGTSHESRVTTG